VVTLELADLLKYSDIVIQCHDNPDADTIASGYALYEYFKAYEKNVKLIYSGRFNITKPNLTEMITELKIPIEYVENIAIDGLLITVDCQYGAGNVKKFISSHVAIIDHHQQEVNDIEMYEIRSYLGSCSTLVWQMLKNESFDFEVYPTAATALYYGLFTDTNNFSEIYHPLDKDLRDSINFDSNLIKKLKNSNLTLSEIQIAGIALLKCSHNEDKNFAIFKSDPCDPNILGFISDLALQVNTVNVCVVYNHTNDGIKFSIRSCIREVMASELAAFLCDGIGSGGGHLEKAGGFISLTKFSEKYSNVAIDKYLFNRVNEYYNNFDLIYSNSHSLNIEDMKLYKKRNLTVGFVPSTDVFQEGTPIMIRTLEGDIDILASSDIYIMIGIKGEVYPIKKEKFERSYRLSNEPFDFETQYSPMLRNRITGQVVELKKYSKPCVATGDVYIYAKLITRDTKVFTNWDTLRYMSGRKGDYIALRQDDMHDAYIIEKSIFYMTYVEV
jgi:phosphoesterase RecJ-like protein